MSEEERERPCAHCGNPHPEPKLDPEGWCAACRRELIGRASLLGHVVAVVVTLGFLAWLFLGADASPGYLVVWLVLGALLYFFVHRVVRRVGFAFLRARS